MGTGITYSLKYNLHMNPQVCLLIVLFVRQSVNFLNEVGSNNAILLSEHLFTKYLFVYICLLIIHYHSYNIHFTAYLISKNIYQFYSQKLPYSSHALI